MDIEDIKQYSNLDEVDIELVNIMDAAKLYLKNAGVDERENDQEYNLAVKMLTDHWYNNRGITNKGYEIPYGFLSIVSQLRG